MVITGASRWSKARCDTWLAMKSPTEDCGKPSSTTTSRLVFLTEAMIVSRSSGRMVLQIDDLGVDAHGRQFRLGLHGVGHADAERHDA